MFDSFDIQLLAPLLIIGLLFLTLLREWLEPDVAAWTAALACAFLGLLPMERLLAVFANPAPVTVASMFVLSAALEKNGVVSHLGRVMGRWSGRSELSILVILCGVACITSAFLNNTAVVAVMMPVAISLAKRAHLSSSRLLIPLSYAGILGGTCTLIGTSTNLVVQGVLKDRGEPALRFFEFTPLGLVFAAVGILYLLLVGRHRLPDLAPSTQPESALPPLIQFRVTPESSLIGKTLVATLLRDFPELDILEVRRRGVPLRERLDRLGIRSGDRVGVTVHGAVDQLESLKDRATETGLELLETREQSTTEAVVPGGSSLEHQPVVSASFRQRYAVRLTRLVRDGEEVTDPLRQQRFEAGDRLHLSGPTEGLARLMAETDLTAVSTDLEDIPPLSRQAWISSGWFLLFVLGAALHDFFPTAFRLPTEGMALLAAVGISLTRCLDQKEIYHSVNWQILFLITGMLAVGAMLDHTGTAAWLAQGLSSSLGDAPGWLVLGVVYFGTMVLTELISNNAAATMVAPVAITLAHQLGYDPRPFVIAVVFAASASFSTPVGYQTNTLVYGVGRYRFADFLRVGIPLNLLLWLIATLIIPRIWPLQP